MAANQKFASGRLLNVTPTDPASTGNSGDPCLLGQVPGVMTFNQASDNTVTIDTQGVYTLSVKGIDGSGNHAVAAGDILYYTSTDTPKLSVKNTGVRFGYALAAVSSGSTASIDVKLGY